MTPEKFKGDPTELKFDNAGRPAMDLIGRDLDDFFNGCYEANPFLLQLYDDRRIPFADRIKREAFLAFIKELFSRYGFVGNVDTHLFVLRAIFGELSEIFFSLPNPGHLELDINATSSLEIEFMGRDLSNDFFNITDHLGNDLMFRALPGIETSAQLALLFSEIMPAGVYYDISLTFFTRYDFVAEEGGDFFDVVDHEGNQIVFVEVG
jgi:hypothetical protein